MITIENEGNNIAPVYNRGEVVLNSTNKNNDRFKYLVDIELRIAGSGPAVNLGRLAVPPHPSLNGAGRVEFHNIVKDYITKEINYDDFAPSGTAQNNNFIRIIMEFGERFKYEWVNPKKFFISGSPELMGLTSDSSLVAGATDVPHEYSEGDLIYIDSADDSIVESGLFRVVNVINNKTLHINQEYKSGTTPNLTVEFADKRTIDFPELEERTVWAFNGAIDFEEQVNYDNDYDLDNDGKLISSLDEDKVYEVNVDDYLTANFYTLNRETYIFGIIKNGDSTSFSLIENQEFGTIGLGPQNVNDNSSGFLEVGDEYEIGVLDEFGLNPKFFKFKIIDRCSKFKNNKVIWLDRMGAWKSFNFELHKVENLNVTNKTTFRRENIGEYNTTNFNKTYDTDEHYKRIESLEFNKSYAIHSDRLTQNQIYYLEDLFTSRFVYILENQGEENERLVPINITDNNYEIADLLYRRRKTLSLSYRVSEKKFNN